MPSYVKNVALLLFRKAMIVAICVFAGTALLAGSYFIPRKHIMNHVRESAVTLQTEGIGRYVWEDSSETILDGHTDGLIVNEASTYDEDGLSDILLNPYVKVGETNPVNSLYETELLANPDYRIKYYGRYWHGYLAVIRPLLLVFNYTEIRHLLMMLQIFLVFVFCWMAAQSDAVNVLIPFAAFWLFLSPVTLFGSLQYAPCFLVTMVMLIVLFGWKEKLDDRRREDLFLLAGIATAYFDLLTYPFVTLGVPLLFYLGTDRKCLLSVKHALRSVFCLSLSWAGGYVAMWGSKWLIASLFTKENIIADAVERVMVRSGHFSESKSPGEVLRLSMQYMDGKRVFLIFLVSVILIAGIRVKKHCPIRKETLPSLGIMLLVSLYSIAWYFAAMEHSTAHGHFVWREFGISIFGVLMMGAADLGKREEDAGRQEIQQ